MDLAGTYSKRDTLATWYKISKNAKQQTQFLRELCGNTLTKYIDEDAFAEFVIQDIFLSSNEEYDRKVVRTYYYLILNNAVFRVCSVGPCSSAVSISKLMKHTINETYNCCEKYCSNPHQDMTLQDCLVCKYSSVLLNFLGTVDTDENVTLNLNKLRNIMIKSLNHLEYPKSKAKKTGIFNVFNNKDETDEKAFELSLQYWNTTFSSLRRLLTQPNKLEDIYFTISKDAVDKLYIPLNKYAGANTTGNTGKNIIPLSLIRHAAALLAIISNNNRLLANYKDAGAAATLNAFVSTFKMKIALVDYFQLDVHTTVSLLQCIHGCIFSEHQNQAGNYKTVYVVSSSVLELLHLYVIPLLNIISTTSTVTPLM